MRIALLLTVVCVIQFLGHVRDANSRTRSVINKSTA